MKVVKSHSDKAGLSPSDPILSAETVFAQRLLELLILAPTEGMKATIVSMFQEASQHVPESEWALMFFDHSTSPHTVTWPPFHLLEEGILQAWRQLTPPAQSRTRQGEWSLLSSQVADLAPLKCMPLAEGDRIYGFLGHASSQPAGAPDWIIALLGKAMTLVLKMGLAQNVESLLRSQAAEKLIPLSRQAVLGNLTASVLHDVNNPMTSILNYAKLLQYKSQQAEVLEYGKQIEKEGGRIVRQLQHLASLARGQSSASAYLDVRDTAELSLKLQAGPMSKEGITVKYESSREPVMAQAPVAALQQAITLLIEEAWARVIQQEPTREKVIVCRVLALDYPGDQWARISLSIPVTVASNQPFNLFENLLGITPEDPLKELSLRLTESLVTEIEGDLSVEALEAGWSAIHLDIPSATSQTA